VCLLIHLLSGVSEPPAELGTRHRREEERDEPCGTHLARGEGSLRATEGSGLCDDGATRRRRPLGCGAAMPHTRATGLDNKEPPGL
jgi:hypothetical protein